MAKKKKFDYFDSFHQQSALAVKEADLLIEIIENFTNASKLYEPMQHAHDIEHAGDEINHKIRKNITLDFITPIDREDLMELAGALDNLIDDIEDIIQHFYIYDVHVMHPDCIEFAKLLKKSCEALHNCTKSFGEYKKNRDKVRQAIIEVNDVEEEADILYVDSMRNLFTEHNDKPMRVIVWGAIFELFEDCCDACEHAADVIGDAVLKNS
ncbi:MAG: DUF47 family protein [Coriobacteriia bacterium]|nr:DUF47 family protein [Coriobacteriia bacterium]